MEANKKNIIKFIIPSILGLVLFLMPVPTEDGLTITIAILAAKVNELLMPIVYYLIYGAIFISAIGAAVTKLFKPNFIMKNETLERLFNVSPIWTAVRVSGAVLALLCLLQVGPEFIISADTGLFLIDGLLIAWLGTILISGTLMDLLLNFGLMEFVGTFLSKIMEPIYKIPGRSAIDCLASWVGDAIIGILITTDQYQTGYYTKRESAVIATTFSAVSISFALLVAVQLQIDHMFFQFFLVTFATGFLCAIIMPRIPPLRNMEDTFINGEVKLIDNRNEKVSFSKALASATERSAKADLNPIRLVKKGIFTAAECALVCMPTVMLIGTASLALFYFTPVFTWLGAPFEPILSLLQIPEAAEAAPCMLAGFGDMFIPSILASATIESEFTRFFVGVISITQLIYMSEVGALLMSSKLPLNLGHLLIIFLERTIICIPIVYILISVFVF